MQSRWSSSSSALLRIVVVWDLRCPRRELDLRADLALERSQLFDLVRRSRWIADPLISRMCKLLRIDAFLRMELHLKQHPRIWFPPPAVDPLVLVFLPGILTINRLESC